MFLLNMFWSSNQNDGQDIEKSSVPQTNAQQIVDHINDENMEQNSEDYPNPKKINAQELTKIHKIPIYEFRQVSEVFGINGYSLDNTTFKELMGETKNKNNLLGKGSFGKVAIIRGIKDNEEYACKQMHLKDKDEKKTKKLNVDFMNEVYYLVNLKNENIVKCVKHFRINDYGFMVLEYAKEGSVDTVLKKKIKKDKRFTENEAKICITHTARALFCLHTTGIAHKDLKLGNILQFKQPNGKIVYKVCDFGKTRNSLKNEDVLKNKRAVGTLNYMSPDLLRAYISTREEETVEGRVRSVDPFMGDMWALGICLYYLLCGENPFISDKEKKQIKNKSKQAMTILNRAEKYKWKIPRKFHKDLSQPCIEFMEMVIEPDRNLRLDIYDAVAHQWINCPDLVKLFNTFG